jgi:hypothetical protein
MPANMISKFVFSVEQVFLGSVIKVSALNTKPKTLQIAQVFVSNPIVRGVEAPSAA